MLPFDVFGLVVKCTTTTSPRHSPALAPRRLMPEARQARHTRIYLFLNTDSIQHESESQVSIFRLTLHILLTAWTSTSVALMRHFFGASNVYDHN